MKLKLYSLAAVLTLGVLVLVNMASTWPVPAAQGFMPTATAAAQGSAVAEDPAGNTNGIAFLGILIFLVIIVTIIPRLRDWRAAERES